MAGWHDVTTGGYYVGFPRWEPDGSLLYVSSNGRQSPALQRVRDERLDRAALAAQRRASNVPLPDGSVVYSQLDLVDPYEDRYDLYREKDGHVTRLTHGARLTSVGRARGRRDRCRALRSGNDVAGARAPRRHVDRALTTASPDTSGRSPSGRATETALRPRDGRAAATRRSWSSTRWATCSRALTRDRASNAHAEWALDDAAIVYASDRTGVSQLYAEPTTGARAVPSIRLTDATTGISGRRSRPMANRSPPWLGERRLPCGRRAAGARARGSDGRTVRSRRQTRDGSTYRISAAARRARRPRTTIRPGDRCSRATGCRSLARTISAATRSAHTRVAATS